MEHTWSLHNGYQLVSNLNMIYQDQQYRQADLDPVSLDDAFFKVDGAWQFIPDRPPSIAVRGTWRF